MKGKKSNGLTPQQTISRNSAAITEHSATEILEKPVPKVGIVALGGQAPTEEALGYHAYAFFPNGIPGSPVARLMIDADKSTLFSDATKGLKMPAQTSSSKGAGASQLKESRRVVSTIQTCPRDSGTHTRIHQPAAVHHRSSRHLLPAHP